MKELIRAINVFLKDWNIAEIISIKENKNSFRITGKTQSGLEVSETIFKEDRRVVCAKELNLGLKGVNSYERS